MTSFSSGHARAASPTESLQSLIRQGRIVFGCARLHHLHSPAQRERLLLSAIDGGLRHFDVAPAYGNGLGERALGRALRTGRGDVAVNTKAGLPARVYPAMGDRAFPLLRGLDMLLGTHARAYATRDFRPATLRASLDQSLRRLGLARIDTFLLHEPMAPFSGTQWSDVAETMVRLRDAGKIRAWGIAGPCRRYDLEHLRSEVPFVAQQPFGDLDEVRPPAFVERRLAFSAFSAFRAARSNDGFPAFLEQAAARHPDASFIVATIDSTRLARWLGEARP
jgi:aryl-alcohol dehydrogenase-like predicted oxidoreductase